MLQFVYDIKESRRTTTTTRVRVGVRKSLVEKLISVNLKNCLILSYETELSKKNFLFYNFLNSLNSNFPKI